MYFSMNNVQKIVVYSTPDCAYCYTLKDYLSEKGYTFEEVDIYEDEEGRKIMEKLSGQKSVPVTVVGTTVIVGWDKKKITDVLHIT